MDHSQHYDQVWGKHDEIKGPCGWIQWKGTNVCMDLHCKCGYHGHVDADFCYYYCCPKCNRLYACGQHIKLIELPPENRAFVEKEYANVIKTCELEEG